MQFRYRAPHVLLLKFSPSISKFLSYSSNCEGEYYEEVSTFSESFHDINQLGTVLEDSKKGIQDKKDLTFKCR